MYYTTIGRPAAERIVRVRSTGVSNPVVNHGAQEETCVFSHELYFLLQPPSAPLYSSCPPLLHRWVDTCPGHHASRLVSTNSPISPTSTYLSKQGRQIVKDQSIQTRHKMRGGVKRCYCCSYIGVLFADVKAKAVVTPRWCRQSATCNVARKNDNTQSTPHGILHFVQRASTINHDAFCFSHLSGG